MALLIRFSGFALVVAMAAGVMAADAVKPDLSTPKAAAKAVYDLVWAGKLEEVKSVFATPANDDEKDLLENGWSDDSFVPGIYAALTEKFPDQVGKGIPDISKMIQALKGSIEGATEKIDGDAAVLTPGGGGGGAPMFQGMSQITKLVKEKGEWKNAVVEGRFLRRNPPQFVAQNKAMKEFYLSMMKDIRAGKYATVEDAKKALDSGYREIQMKFGPPVASMPASGGSTLPH